MPQTRNEQKETEEKPCEICQMNKTMAAIAASHLSCSAIKEDDARGECMKWANEIDPSNVKDVEKLMMDAYDRSGIEGLSVLPNLYNELSKKVIMKKVGDKVANGIQITENERKLYNEFKKADAKKGI